MWKPGQIVTIDGIVYRVKRNNKSNGTCEKCALSRGPFCMWNGSKEYLLPADCYLTEIKPKS